MKAILDILKKTGDWHPGLYLKIENTLYMEVAVDLVEESGPCSQ